MRFRPTTLFLVLLAGCGSDDPEPTTARPTATGTATATATATATPSPTPEGIDPLTGASTDPVVVKATDDPTRLLTEVRAARHEGFDRVVFQFDRGLPGYDIRYERRPITADGSGDEVAVDGEHVVVVRMENALDADLSKPGAPLTYRGPMRFSPSTPVVAELVRTGGFEGVLTWAIGLRDRVEFRVLPLHRPDRLVIDFRNH